MPGTKTIMFSAFAAELQKIAVSEEEAVDAAKLISQDPRSRARKYLDAGVVGGVLNPAVGASGHFVKGFVDTRGGVGRRFAGGVREMGSKTTKGEVARSAHTGLFGGMAVQAGREGLQAQRARATVDQFLREHREG